MLETKKAKTTIQIIESASDWWSKRVVSLDEAIKRGLHAEMVKIGDEVAKMSSWTLEESVSWERVRERAVHHQTIWETRRQQLGNTRAKAKDMENIRNSG